MSNQNDDEPRTLSARRISPGAKGYGPDGNTDEFRAAFLAIAMDADHWRALPSLAPMEAALFLSGHNPDKVAGIDLADLPTRHREDGEREAPPTPGDVKTMLRTFERGLDADAPRTLADWLRVANQHGLKVDGPVRALLGTRPPGHEADGARRLRLLRAMGGDVKPGIRGEGLRVSGIGHLVEKLKADGEKRSDEKTVRADLVAAFEDERKAHRSGKAPESSAPVSSFPGWRVK